jgi:hypothetical protein
MKTSEDGSLYQAHGPVNIVIFDARNQNFLRTLYQIVLNSSNLL